MQNGSLMFILAHLLQNNPLWKDTTIRLLRTIAKAKIIHSDNYRCSLIEHSASSEAVLMGAYISNKDNFDTYFESIDSLTKNIPQTFFIYFSGDADLLA